jgi:ATP-binding cassette subfamily C protein
MTGQVVERGSHTALLAAGGRYSDLYERQFPDSPNERAAA